ncbi:MAG: CHAT domain-containing protein [Aureispira sp.]|nr:CHAT domain-containing protein [Aureispira sp.]
MKVLYSIFILFLVVYVSKGQTDTIPSVVYTDYVIDTNGVKHYGEIKKAAWHLMARKIHFKHADDEQIYNPTDIIEWKKDSFIYVSKIYKPKVKKREAFDVFMRHVTSGEGPLEVYEFHNSFVKTIPFMQTFLERGDSLTEVKFGKFRKHMREYFSDSPQMLKLIEESNVHKKDLLDIVAEYNDFMHDSLALFKKRKVDAHKDGVEIWDLNDLTLDPNTSLAKMLLALAEETKAIKDADIRTIEVNFKMGLTFFEQRQYDLAIPYLKKALKKIQKSKKVIEKKARVEFILADIYYHKKKYNSAIKYNSSALHTWKDSIAQKEDIHHSFDAFMTQGKLFKKLPNSSKNLDWYEAVVSSREKDWEAALRTRGLRPIKHGTKPDKSTDFSLALLCFKKAKDLIPKLSHKVAKRIDVNLSIGALFFEARDYNRSRKYYQTALRLIQTHYTGKYKHPRKAETIRMLGEILLANKLYDEALSYIMLAQHVNFGEKVKIDGSLLENISKIKYPVELLNSIAVQGEILFEKNKKNPSEKELKKVIAHYDIATKLAHKLRQTHRAEGSKYHLATVTHKFCQHAVLVCDKLYEISKNEDYLQQAFHYAELSKSAILFETMHDLKSMKIAGVPKDLITKENGLKAQISYLKGELFYELQNNEVQNKRHLKLLKEKIAAITEEHQKLVEKIEREYPRYYNLKYNYDLANLKELQEGLEPNQVLLEYVVADSFIYVLAIGQQDVKSQLVKCSSPISLTARRFQSALILQNIDMYTSYGYDIYQQVIGDLAPFLQGKKLVIIPDAQLHYIPFGVLPTNLTQDSTQLYRNFKYLIEEHPICYNYSAGLFLLSKAKKDFAATKPFSAWAPSFDMMERIMKEKGFEFTLEPLPGAQKEAKEIAKTLGGDSYIANQATEAQFKEVANQYSVLHIATHGLLNDVEPQYSSLIMTAEGKDDGILHAFELYSMELNAELAVLSACNSGMGKLIKGEGIVSIARGFTYAGVPNIVMSKWHVSDWATAVLMKLFYKGLQDGLPKDEALQQAKIQYLEEHKRQDKILAPFYWGSFVLLGNSTPIDVLVEPTKIFSLRNLLVLLVLLLVAYFISKQRKKNAI